MAMALFDTGFEPKDFTIDAVDVSSRNLALAKRARYGRNSFRGNDLGFRARYFEAVDGDFRPHEIVRRQVRFALGNILDPTRTPERETYDIIFCRNLLIYFDDASRSTAADNLHNRLVPGGYLCLGHSESMARISDRFDLVSLSDAIVYRRA